MSPLRPAPRPARPVAPAYVDTPAGLFSAGGVRYRTTERLLREFAGGVEAHVPLPDLVAAADAFAEAPRVAAAAGLLVGLVLLSPPWAVALSLTLWLAAALAAPGVASLGVARVLRALSGAGVQGLAFAVVLSVLASQGRLDAVWTGLAGFLLLRLGVVERLLRPLAAPALAHLYALPPADQTLRALVVRAAIRHRVSLPATAAMEARVRAFWRRGED